jgi:dihydrofolate reductase
MLYNLDLTGVPLGEAPPGLKILSGDLTLVMKDGARMLRASKTTELLVLLPEYLPQNFSVEFDLVPKGCCNPEDLAFEGTRRMNQGVESARIAWDSDGYLRVVGGGELYQAPMPEELSTTLPGTLTHVAVSFEGGTVKLYTNGTRLYTLADRRFVRGKVLRVFLGGQDDAKQAVYLAALRVATNDPPSDGMVASGFVPGSRTVFDLNMASDSLGTFPKQLKALSGSMSVVMRDGIKMLRATNVSSFLVPLPEVLPADFTVEFEVIPKLCCNPADLAFEGTAAIDMGAGSARVTWDSDGQLMVVGGGEMYQAAIPEALGLITPGVLTSVWVSGDGGTLKLYTNGRRLFTLSDRRFARSKVLRVELGAQEGADYAVLIARLRIGTNSPPPPAAARKP